MGRTTPNHWPQAESISPPREPSFSAATMFRQETHMKKEIETRDSVLSQDAGSAAFSCSALPSAILPQARAVFRSISSTAW